MVRTGYSSNHWARSNDGGATWQHSREPANASPPTPTTRQDVYDGPGPLGPQQVCAAGRNCWRIRDRRFIEQLAPDGTTTVELRFSDVEISDTSTCCSHGKTGVLASITALETDRGVVAASLGAEGVLVRQGDGRWERTGVLGAPTVEPKSSGFTAVVALVALALVLAFVVWQFDPRRPPAWKRGLIVLGTGALMTVVALSGIAFVSGANADVSGTTTRTAAIATLLTLIATVVTACWTRPLRR